MTFYTFYVSTSQGNMSCKGKWHPHQMSHGTETRLKWQDQSASQPGVWDLFLSIRPSTRDPVVLFSLQQQTVHHLPWLIKFHCECCLSFWTTYTFFKKKCALAAHIFCDYPIYHCKMEERLFHWREEQYTGGEPALPGIQVQLLRILYKWLFFKLEHVKSKFLPTSCQQLWINFLSLAVLFCNFWQRNDVFEMPHVFCRLPLWAALLWPFQ